MWRASVGRLEREDLYAMLYECVTRSPGFAALKLKVLEAVDSSALQEGSDRRHL
jgi:hypothetical protein